MTTCRPAWTLALPKGTTLRPSRQEEGARTYGVTVDVVVVANPTKFDDLPSAQRWLAARVQALGHEAPRWYLTTLEDPGTELSRRAAEAGADLVLSWGGDGTTRAVAEGVAHTDTSLGILPGGTGNLLARNLGVPLDLAEALNVAYGQHQRRIDMMDVSMGRGVHHKSLVMCGIGWDALMMDVSERTKARFGWGAYALQGLRTFRDHPIRLRVRVDDGEEFTFYGRTCLIANVGSLVGGLTLLPESHPDDGLLEVLVFDPTTSVDYLRTSWGLLRGATNSADPSRTLIRGKKAVVTTHRPRPRQIDGDLVDDGYGFVVRMEPAALSVKAPRSIDD